MIALSVNEIKDSSIASQVPATDVKRWLFDTCYVK